eukprot:CAMPEP_0201695830 /NCGR_PEP_ID=MMETSP0578-20130828/7665_1 /ASSEMBLY_ACC=CAM_ASM_000663 /TAXON_ID=267565 /ORGANISM="Skeletonema grethea, Strain CCMP 1804" /LENGTH=472 /DNA_ID=CAMNT_0048181735 /DNA_START=58 /DNA_END=1476 /DNA_ORIENTATION=-
MAAAMLLASPLSSTEAFSAVSRINAINTNHQAAIVIAPRLDNQKNAAHRTRRSTTVQLSATTSNKNHADQPSTLRAKANQAVHKLRKLFLHLSAILTHKSKLILLSTMLSIATIIPQSAVAKSGSSSLFSLGGSGGSSSVEDASSLVVSKSSGGGGGRVVRKVGKFVVTVGAIGAGASFANCMKNKFADSSCSEDDEDEKSGVDGESSKNNEGEITNTNGSSVVQPSSSSSQQKTETEETAANDKKTTEIEPMSEEWIQQQLNDVEKRSNVLNDAIKMTQPAAAPAVVATKSNNKGTATTKTTPPKINGGSNNKKVSVGNTIGIPSTTPSTTAPLVKNLDSKIEMLQRRDAERSIEQQRINDELTQVEMEKKKVAIVEAERKIELAEKEYRKSQLQQQVQVVVVEETKEEHVVVEEESTTAAEAAQATISIKFGPGGSPAKSRQEDLELTREVILDHVNSMDSMGSGVLDDE